MSIAKSTSIQRRYITNKLLFLFNYIRNCFIIFHCSLRRKLFGFTYFISIHTDMFDVFTWIFNLFHAYLRNPVYLCISITFR